MYAMEVKKPLPVILADEHILTPVIEAVEYLGWFRRAGVKVV